MPRVVAIVALAGLLASCAASPSAVSSPTPAPVSPTASPTPSPSPRPTSVVGAKGFITLTSPSVNATLQSPVLITGDASVFEAALQWRITDTGGQAIAEGITTASQGAPGRGTFSVTVPYSVRSDTVAFVEVYSRSPKDGNIDDLVRVPVTLR